MRWRTRLVMFTLPAAVLCSLLACQHPSAAEPGNTAAAAPGASDIYFPPPGGAWKTVSPREAGWDPAKLEAALNFAGERKSSGVVVLHKGRILAERYWDLNPAKTTPGGRPNRYYYMRRGADGQGHVIEDVASVQKSVVSILVGIARQRGLVRLDDPVTKYLGPGWSKAPREAEARITLRHLITMTSGLTGNLEFEAPAGARWRYNTRAYALSRKVVCVAAKMDPNTLTREWLTGPVGMADSKWVPRPGAVVGAPAVNQLGFATTARDLARFGLLIQAGGVWNGRVIIADREYLHDALSPSQELNPSYGYLWWLNGQPFVRRGAGTRKFPGWLIPTAPKDLVAALGALGRKLYVVPSLGLVVTRLGDAPEVRGEEAFDQGFWKRLMQARETAAR